MSRKISSLKQFEQFKAELAAVPEDVTRFNLQRRLQGSIIDYYQTAADIRSSGGQIAASLISHISVAQAQEAYEIHAGQRSKRVYGLGWLPISRAAVLAVGSEAGVPNTLLEQSVLFDDTKLDLLRGLSRLACAYTEPGGAYNEYQLAAGVATGQVGFNPDLSPVLKNR